MSENRKLETSATLNGHAKAEVTIHQGEQKKQTKATLTSLTESDRTVFTVRI